MNARDKSILVKFKELISKRVRVNRMFLFGSRARGDDEAGSDMDVLVIVEQPEEYELLMFVYDCAYEAGLECGVLLNVVVVSRDRWENSPERSSLLAEAVRREGIAV